MSRPYLIVALLSMRFLYLLPQDVAYLLFPCLVSINPIIPLFSLGTLWYLHRLPLYYKKTAYYCLGPVVKSPVLYFPFSRFNPVLYSLVSCGSQLRCD
jgi:hypothetical protein